MTRLSLSEGMLSETGSPLDVAIVGDGFFELSGPKGSLYTRNGQFRRDVDGRLLGLGDLAVQGVGGGDILLPEEIWSIQADGSIVSGDRTVARLALFGFDADKASSTTDGLLTAQEEDVSVIESPQVRSGFLEGANVVLADEMIALMEAVRRAETGQKLMNVYDDLMGRAITTFGQGNG